MTLRHETDVSVADWFTTDPRTDPSYGPAGFVAYARLLLPGREEGIEGHIDPPELRLLCSVLERHTTTPERVYCGLWDGFGELQGGEAVAFLTAFSGPLRWPGRIFKPERRELPPPAFPAEVMDAPRVTTRFLDFLLFRGPVREAGEWGARPYGSGVPREINSPNLMWPADRSWFVTASIDESWACVAGSTSLIDALLGTPGLETVRTTHPEH